MTIEEYLNKRIEDLQDGPCNSSLVQGKILAFEEILSKLPEMEHEVTLREVEEECQSHLSKGGCKKCPLNKTTRAYDCMVFPYLPSRWESDDIQKRMKEDHN